MKTRILASLAVLAVLAAAAPSRAADAPPAGAHEMAAVEQFLGLSDPELDQLAQVIARLRAMTLEQRTALRAEIARYRQLPENQREQLRAGWGWMPREIQDGWREMMHQLPEERRAAIQRELQSLPPERKAEYRRRLVEEYLKSKSPRP